MSNAPGPSRWECCLLSVVSLTGSAIFLFGLLLLIFGGLAAAALPLGISIVILGLLGIRQRQWGYSVNPRAAWLYAWFLLFWGVGLIVLSVVLAR